MANGDTTQAGEREASLTMDSKQGKPVPDSRRSGVFIPQAA